MLNIILRKIPSHHGEISIMIIKQYHTHNREENDLNSGKIAQCLSTYGKIHLNTGKNHSFYVNFLLP